MARKISSRVLFGFTVFAVGLCFSLSSYSLAAEKIRVATPIRDTALHFMPLVTAQEMGFWKEQGIEGIWYPFANPRLLTTALSKGEVDIVLGPVIGMLGRTAAGLKQIVVADVEGFQRWAILVPSDSPIKSPGDLKGKKIGVAGLGTVTHAYGLAMAKAVGIDKEVKFVGAGTHTVTVAAVMSGAIDAAASTTHSWAPLEVEGKVRRVVEMADYLPADWDPLVITVSPGLLEKEPELIKKVIVGILRANAYIMDNPQWALEKMKAMAHLSTRVAEENYKLMKYSRDGKIYPERIERMKSFAIDYGLIPREKLPPLKELYSGRFVPVQ